jgi:hypothetical protein
VSFVQKYLDYFQKSVATSEASKNDIENQTQKGTVLRRSCSLSFIKYIAKVNTCGSTIMDIRPPPGVGSAQGGGGEGVHESII